MKSEISIYKFFVIVATIFGITFSILMPLYQVPDELTHINLTYSEMNMKIDFQKSFSKTTSAEGVATNSKKKMDVSKYFNLSNTIKIKNQFHIPSINIVRHFPQAIAMLICNFFDMPVIIYITICEIVALAFYIFICTLALKKMPCKKNLLMFIMLLPVCLQQMASFSYDVVLNSFCFLFIASIFNLRFQKKNFEILDFIRLILMLLVIAICKIPYIILSLLMLLIPIDKVHFSVNSTILEGKQIKKFIKKYKLPVFILLIVLICICGFCIIMGLRKIAIGRVLLATMLHPLRTISLLQKTFHICGPSYFNTIVGNLGWFDTPLSILFQLFVWGSLLFCIVLNSIKKEEKEKYKLKIWEVIFIYLFVIIFICLIIVSLFMWTLQETNIPNSNNLSISEYSEYLGLVPYIGGVQGRYFIPIIFLILFPINLSTIKSFLSKIKLNYFFILYYLIMYTYLFIVLLYRYWI